MKNNRKSVKPGDIFGALEVLERVGSSPRGAATFRCLCRACGKEAIKEGQRLTDKRHPATNCGCVYQQKTRDISGETHGCIDVIELLPRRSSSGEQIYRVRCAICKNTREMPKSQILSDPASCGCRHYDPERMASASKIGVRASIVDGVNINSVFKREATTSSKTGIRGVFPEKRNGILTGTYRAAVMVHGERMIQTGFESVESAKKWRDVAQEKLIEKHKVEDTRKEKE